MPRPAPGEGRDADPERPPPRLLLCTSGGLFGTLVLQRLLASPAVSVAAVVKSTRVLHPRQGWLQGALSLLRRSGLRYALYLGAATGGAELLGRWRGQPAVDVAARLRDLPVLATPDLNDLPGRDFVARPAPDLLLSAFFNQRVGEALCAIPSLGAVNIHPSLLPHFKGIDPVLHARLRGSQDLGVSVHRISPAFDAGALLAQAPVAIDPAASLLAATAQLFDRGAQLLLDTLPLLQAGFAGRPQPPGGSYDSWPTPAEVRAYRRAGHRLLRMDDLRRGFPPARQ